MQPVRPSENPHAKIAPLVPSALTAHAVMMINGINKRMMPMSLFMSYFFRFLGYFWFVIHFIGKLFQMR